MFDSIVTVMVQGEDTIYCPLSQLVFGKSKVLPTKHPGAPFRIYVNAPGRFPELRTETTSWFEMYQKGEITPDTDAMFDAAEGVVKAIKLGVTKDRFVNRQHLRDELQPKRVSDAHKIAITDIPRPVEDIESEWKKKYGFP